jgi:hypothetical protein
MNNPYLYIYIYFLYIFLVSFVIIYVYTFIWNYNILYSSNTSQIISYYVYENFYILWFMKFSP